MTTQEDMEEFDSGWQKGVWDFAVVTSESNEIRYILHGPIDYRYSLNYGIITMEHFNCCAYSYYRNDDERNLVNLNRCIKDKTKTIDVDIQYYWYKNNESWHFANSFCPNLISVYNYIKPNHKLTQTASKPKEMYEMALLMDCNHKYRKILSGPITYQVLFKNVCFNEILPYIKGDINVLRKYGFCVKKVQVNDFFSLFTENPRHGVVFNFNRLKKVELWELHHDKKHKWERYKAEQQEEKYDIVLITNHQKVIKYILNNVIINCVEEIIKFTSYDIYESGNRQILEDVAIRIKGFGIAQYKLWLDEYKTNFIMDTLYETIRYNNFVFPDEMKPFKAFFYRFRSLQNKYVWTQYKHHGIHNMSMDNLYFQMDSNRQLIYNNTTQIRTKVENDENKDNNNDNEYNETASYSMMDNTYTESMEMKSQEMSVNDSIQNDDDGRLSMSVALTNVENQKCKMYLKPLPDLPSKPSLYNQVSVKDVWDLYLREYGFEPNNATQLMQFSKYSPDVAVMKYVDAREYFNKRKNQII